MGVWPPSELVLVRAAAVGHVHYRDMLERANAAYWHAIALYTGLFGLLPVRGWPSRCKPFDATAASAACLAGVLLESSVVALTMQNHPAGHSVAVTLVIFSMHVVALLAALRQRRALADASECLRLYCAHRTPPARAPAATMLLALLLPLHMAMYVYDVVAFFPKNESHTDRALAFLGSATFLAQQLQWTAAFYIMLHPMLQVGSLAEDLRQGCSWLARERLARERLARERLAPCKRMKDAARPYDGAQAWRRLRLEQQMLYDVCNAHFVVYQERILLVVMNTLITPTIYLANSILEIARGDVSSTTLAAAFIGLHYFAYFGAFSFIGQRFFFESARSKEILHGFLVQADPRQIEENDEVSKFITQIERQTKYRVWGLFQIDTNFTLGVLLAATTHVALLCQVGASFYN